MIFKTETVGTVAEGLFALSLADGLWETGVQARVSGFSFSTIRRKSIQREHRLCPVLCEVEHMLLTTNRG